MQKKIQTTVNAKELKYLMIFFCLLLFCNNAWASPLSDKLTMLGYSEEEIRGIVSGRKNFKAIQLRYKIEMLGYEQAKPSPMKSILQDHPLSRTLVGKGLSEKEKCYLDIVKDAAEKNNIAKSLLLAVIKVESDFDANAVSPKGAMGLMQLMPGTADDLGVKDPFDPRENIQGGAKYLSDCINNLMDLKLGLAAYNAGPNLVARLKKIPSITETQNYVENVMKHIKIYEGLTFSK